MSANESLSIETIFRAVEIAVKEGPVSIERVAEATGRGRSDPAELLADLMREAGRQNCVLSCGIPRGQITAIQRRAN